MGAFPRVRARPRAARGETECERSVRTLPIPFDAPAMDNLIPRGTADAH